MSEHHFGRLKKRFPLLRQLRTHLPLSQKTILACTVVHNLLSRWRNPVPEDAEEDGDDQHQPEEQVVVLDDTEVVSR